MAEKTNNQSKIRTTENDPILAHMAQNLGTRAQMEAQEMKRLGGNYTTTPLVTRLADEHNEQERIAQEAVKKPTQVKYFREKAKRESPTTKATSLVKRQSANDRLKAKYGKNYNPEAIRAKQRKLIAAGYDLGKSGVDGDWGPKSKQAWQDYKSKQNKSQIQQNLVKSQNPYKGLTNIEAITKFKTLNRVTAPYYIIDKQNHQLLKMQGDKVLAKDDIMLGLNTTSDGFTRLTKNTNGGIKYDNQTNLMATGAGVWTIGNNYPYGGGRAYHLRRTINKEEPYYQANDTFGAKNPIETYSRKTLKQESQAIHPMPSSRQKDFKNGTRYKSFGCINVQPDFLKKLNPQKGDSVYIIPGVKGNYMYVDTRDNHIKTHYSDTNNQKDNYNYGKKYHFNNINYNTSY